MKFVNSVINYFQNREHDPMIPSYLINNFKSKPIVLIDVPFCNGTEKVPKELLKKLKAFTKEKLILELIGKQRK